MMRDPIERKVLRRRKLTWLALFWEQLWPAVLPALCVAALFVGLAIPMLIMLLLSVKTSIVLLTGDLNPLRQHGRLSVK